MSYKDKLMKSKYRFQSCCERLLSIIIIQLYSWSFFARFHLTVRCKRFPSFAESLSVRSREVSQSEVAPPSADDAAILRGGDRLHLLQGGVRHA